jgi:hypothetical protein
MVMSSSLWPGSVPITLAVLSPGRISASSSSHLHCLAVANQLADLHPVFVSEIECRASAGRLPDGEVVGDAEDNADRSSALLEGARDGAFEADRVPDVSGERDVVDEHRLALDVRQRDAATVERCGRQRRRHFRIERRDREVHHQIVERARRRDGGARQDEDDEDGEERPKSCHAGHPTTKEAPEAIPPSCLQPASRTRDAAQRAAAG